MNIDDYQSFPCQIVVKLKDDKYKTGYSATYKDSPLPPFEFTIRDFKSFVESKDYTATVALAWLVNNGQTVIVLEQS